MLRPARPLAPPRGIATVLILLLVGLSLSAAVLGTAHYIRSHQQQDVAAHAQTQAQMKAWTGAELVRQYLQQLQDSGQLAALHAKAPPFDLTLSGDGVTSAVLARVTASDSTAGTLTARLTGVTAPDSPAEARAVLEVVYAAGTGSGMAPSQCGAPVRASTVFRGDVTINGEGASFESNEHYADVAIDGSLIIEGGGAYISGCTKGDITLEGGGIDANATLSSQNGTITLNGMGVPTNVTVWGRDIRLGGGISGGNFAAIKAGAYQANVVVDSVVLGTARVGGRLTPSTAGSALPWRSGALVPWTPGGLLVTLVDGGEFLVDMAAVTVASATGIVTGAQAAAEKVNTQGSAALPDVFMLQSTAIDGGAVSIDTQAPTVTLAWGYGTTTKSGSYTEIKSAGDFKTDEATIDRFTGGGIFWASQGRCTYSVWNDPTQCGGFSNMPRVINPSNLAGALHLRDRQPIPYSNGPPTLSQLRTRQANTTPGLPGVPFCDTRTETFDAAAFRSSANYIFEFDASGTPRLTIQHMKASNGTSIDRANIDLTAVDPVPATAPGAMTLRRVNGVDFLGCGNQSPSNQYSDALACLRNATPANGWNLNGITKFPPGIALFIGPVTIDGVGASQGTLHNTLLSTGGVTLTGAGHGPLVAPNLASPLTPVCDAPFYPANLCDKSTTPSSLAKWTDAEGQEHAGVPLANLAVGTNQGFSGAGWNITGNVIVGGAFDTSGASVNIAGAVTVGANQRSNTTIGAGGMRVDTTRLTRDQGYLPGGNCAPAATPQPVAMKWSRYL